MPPNTEEWSVFDSGFTGASGVDHGIVVFTSTSWPCLQLGFTLLPDGSIISFGAGVDDYEVTDTRITVRFIRSLPIEALSRRALAELRQLPERPETWDMEDGDAAGGSTDFRRRTGRAGRPDRDYAFVAHLYVEALAQNEPVIPRVAQQLGIDTAAARNAVHKARSRGLLTRPPRGRAGGELTQRARNLLAGIVAPCT